MYLLPRPISLFTLCLSFSLHPLVRFHLFPTLQPHSFSRSPRFDKAALPASLVSASSSSSSGTAPRPFELLLLSRARRRRQLMEASEALEKAKEAVEARTMGTSVATSSAPNSSRTGQTDSGNGNPVKPNTVSPFEGSSRPASGTTSSAFPGTPPSTSSSSSSTSAMRSAGMRTSTDDALEEKRTRELEAIIARSKSALLGLGGVGSPESTARVKKEIERAKDKGKTHREELTQSVRTYLE